MSYILDALNKSERERERHQPPGLNSVHHKHDASPGRRSPLWHWLAGLFLLAVINILLVGYWTSNETPAPVANQAETDTRRIEKQSFGTEDTVSPTAPTERSPSSGTMSEGDLITPSDASPIQPVRISALPASVQEKIPDLSFTSHIYSDEPSLRGVTINHRYVREGDSLGSDLTLIEITEDGVVLRYRHYTFEMSVIRDWSFN